MTLQAPSAQAYPAVSCTVTITPTSQHLKAGQPLKLVGHSTVTSTWTVKFNGITHYYTGTSFTATYITPKVTKRTVIGLTVTCSNSSGALTLGYRIVVDPFTLPSTGGHLPNTGGPSLWWLLAGLALVVFGAAAMARHRQPVAQPAARHRRRH